MLEAQEKLNQTVIEGVPIILKRMLCKNVVFPENTFWKRNSEKHTVFLYVKLKISLIEYVTYFIYIYIFSLIYIKSANNFEVDFMQYGGCGIR